MNTNLKSQMKNKHPSLFTGDQLLYLDWQMVVYSGTSPTPLMINMVTMAGRCIMHGLNKVN